MLNLRRASRVARNGVRQFQHGELMRIAHIHRAREFLARIHHQSETCNQVVHVAERTRLRSITKDRQRLATNRLPNEIADYTPVVGMHARPVGIEDSYYFDRCSVHASVIKAQRFCGTLALVVTRARTNRIDVAAV